MENSMHMLLALVGRALLRPRRTHPLADPLDAPEWAGLWRVFGWRARLQRRLGGRAHRPVTAPVRSLGQPKRL
jgi:hypothetical protein